MSAFSELKALLSLRGLETDPTIAEEIAKLYDDCRPSWLDLLAVKPKVIVPASYVPVQKDSEERELGLATIPNSISLRRLQHLHLGRSLLRV